MPATDTIFSLSNMIFSYKFKFPQEQIYITAKLNIITLQE